jgi:hypothetical protein
MADFVISSGHGLYVRGASGILDEVDEARKVVDRLAKDLNAAVFHDNASKSQDENLNRIVSFHNSQERLLDISVHFNAYVETHSPMGCEVLYVTQNALASQLSLAIANAGGFINRGGKKRSDLYFLNHTNEPAILIEVCFVDSVADAQLYQGNFEPICEAIAGMLQHPNAEEPEVSEELLVHLKGKVSWFGGPNDEGVDPDEGLAFIYGVEDAPWLFLPHQPEGTTGLARRLNPNVHYVACRWDYDQTSREMLLNEQAIVRAGGHSMKAFPADWGPHVDTGRIADISPGLMEDLGITTDAQVEVIFPA